MVEFKPQFSVDQESLPANPMIQEKQTDAAFSRSRVSTRILETIGGINGRVKGLKLLPLACGWVLAGMLVAGLWPFHSPRNQVTWLGGRNGLRFGRHGMILSSGRFSARSTRANGPCSLEVWFEPAGATSSGTLFSFYAPDRPRRFWAHQSDVFLGLRSDLTVGRYRTLETRLYVQDVFIQGKPSFVTVTSKGGLTQAYVNGALVRTADDFPLSSRDFDGQLVIANRPELGNSWRGSLFGLAFYDEALSPAQVLQHFDAWSGKGRPDLSESDRARALYLFDERAGSVIHNRASGPDLRIPDHYMVLDQVFLRPFWLEYYPTWSYWGDVLINIVGFVPFGFLFCAYLSSTGGIKKSALLTILLGFALSLTIECLQSFLPTRDSGTTDLITNTLGTCIGVGLFRSSIWRVVWAKIWMRWAGS